jgi:hypothetical protein
VADKLFRAKFKQSAQPTWFLIHTEVQVTRQADFAQRMFTCYYRILDRFHEPVVCIGILGDNSKTWRPDIWEANLLGCRLLFEFPVIKLQDFANKIVDLQNSPNPFATVIASHLRAQASTDSPEERYRFKVDLVRTLYEKNWQADQVRQLFRFIDWVMDLPTAMEIQFRDVLTQIEMEKHMRYVTSIERLAKIEGKIEGKNEGKIKGKIQLLQDLLGLRISSDDEIDAMTASELETLYLDLRQRVVSR